MATIGDGGQPLHPSSGQEIKHEQEKAKARRRKAKTQTMRESACQGEDRLTPFGARQSGFLTLLLM